MRRNSSAVIDAQADAVYFYLPLVPHIGHGESVENVVTQRPGDPAAQRPSDPATQRPSGAIALDIDAHGRLLGIEVVGARSLLRESTIEGLKPLN